MPQPRVVGAASRHGHGRQGAGLRPQRQPLSLQRAWYGPDPSSDKVPTAQPSALPPLPMGFRRGTAHDACNSDDDPWGETDRRLHVRADGCDSSTIVMPDRNHQAQHRKFSGNLLPVAASRRAEVP